MTKDAAARLRLKTWICVAVVVFSNAFGDFFMKRGMPGDSQRSNLPEDQAPSRDLYDADLGAN